MSETLLLLNITAMLLNSTITTLEPSLSPISSSYPSSPNDPFNYNDTMNDDNELQTIDYIWIGLGWTLRVFGSFGILICFIRYSVHNGSLPSNNNSNNNSTSQQQQQQVEVYTEEHRELRKKVVRSIFQDHIVNKNNFDYDIESNTYNIKLKEKTKTKKMKKKKDTTANNGTAAADNGIDTTSLCCSICLDKFEENDVVSILPCSHVFHKDCLSDWAVMPKDECPMCRKDMWDTTIYQKIEKEIKTIRN